MTTSLSPFGLDPFPWFKMMRESAPVYLDPRRHNWYVFSYNDVQRVLSEYSTFSSQFIGSDQPLDASMINMDPPRHRQLRSLVTLAFTPRAIARLTSRITDIVNELLDKVTSQGKMDVINDLSYPLPVIVIAELLGIPREDRERFKHWSDQLVGSAPSDGTDPQAEMSHYFKWVIEQRRKEPKDDLISALLAAQIDGKHRTEQELLGFCVLLLTAGNETTTHLIGNAIWCFDDRSEAWAELKANPALLPDAIEEVLRYRSPVKLMFRVTTHDTRIGDKDIPAGSGMIAWIGSANRDDAQFPNADTFDIHRSSNRHLAFGHGIHFCLGAPLARLESKIALGIMLERLPDIRRDRDIELEPVPAFILHGLKRLPIVFTASY
ncbi:MAG: monooxygenase YjiB [Ktedonobacteraceae bacterium]